MATESISSYSLKGINQKKSSFASTPIIQNGLILNYDAGINSTISSNILFDTSSNNNNGILFNGASQVSNYFNFDGVDNYIEVNAPLNDFTNGFTFCGFLRFNETKTWERILEFSNGWGKNTIQLYRESNTATIGFQVNRGTVSDNYAGITSANQIVNGQTAFFAAVYNNTSCTLYKNGSQIATTSVSSATIPNVNRSFNAFGKSGFIGDGYFSGFMYQLSIYNRALTSGEISDNFNALRNRYGL